MDYGKLAFTGSGVTIGAVVLGQFQLVAIATGIIAVGIVCIRVAWRRGKAVDDNS